MTRQTSFENELTPLLDRGYLLISAEVDERHWGNTRIVLDRPPIRLRLLRDRREWVADIGRMSTDGDTFDSTWVLRAVGVEGFEGPEASLTALVHRLQSTADVWEQHIIDDDLFQALRDRCVALGKRHASEQFGYDGE